MTGREQLERVVRVHPPARAVQRLASRLVHLLHVLLHELHALFVRELVLAPDVGHVELEPVQPVRGERLAHVEEQQAAAHVVAEVVQVRRDGVAAACRHTRVTANTCLHHGAQAAACAGPGTSLHRRGVAAVGQDRAGGAGGVPRKSRLCGK